MFRYYISAGKTAFSGGFSALKVRFFKRDFWGIALLQKNGHCVMIKKSTNEGFGKSVKGS